MFFVLNYEERTYEEHQKKQEKPRRLW